jgi:RimJ/RimL family protein N-acetyltransferase
VAPAYRLQTPRLVIRCWQPADAPALKSAIDGCVEYLREWMPWAHEEPLPLSAKVEFLRRKRGLFDLGQDFGYGIFDGQERHLLGSIGLHARVGPDAREIGYWIRQDQASRGLATEAAAAITWVAFTLDQVERVEIHCDPANQASVAVARKLGYRHEATLSRRFRMPNGDLRDTMLWTMFAADFAASPAAAVKVEAFDVMGEPLVPAQR